MPDSPPGLDRFDPRSVRRGAAALTLEPGNLDRMRALAELCRSLPAADAADSAERPAMRPEDWRAWLAGDSGSGTRETVPDGVFDAPTYAEAELAGERVRLIAGELAGPDVSYRAWTRALLSVVRAASDEHVGEALLVLLAAATLSERAVQVAPIDFGLPDHASDGAIAVPADERYDRLLAAVEVSLDELGDDLIRPDALAPLAATPAVAPEDRWRFPLVLDDTSVVLASPPDLLLAALVHAAQVALRTPSWRLLLYELQREASEVVERSVADMGWSTVERAGTSFLFRFDTDKLAAVELLIAPIAPFGTRHARSGRDVELAYERLAARRRADPAVELGFVVMLGDGRPVELPAHEHMEPPFGPWVLTLHELRAIGDALRLQATYLWRLLRRALPPPWPSGADILDVLGTLAYLDGAPDQEQPLLALGGLRRGQGGAEALHQRALANACRHTAPAPDGASWVTVSRWSGTWDPALHAPEQDVGRFGIVARGRGRYCWILAPPGEGEPDDVLAILIRLVGHVAARLIAAGWLIAPATGGDEGDEEEKGDEEKGDEEDEGRDGDEAAVELSVRLELSFADAPGPALALGGPRGAGRLTFGPGFLHALARPDNDAERAIAAALVHWWLPVLDAEVRGRLVDHVAPAGLGTLLVWPDPESRTISPLEPASPVAVDERRLVGDEVAHALVGETEVLVAQGGQEANELLKRVNQFVLARIDEEVAGFSSDLLTYLVRRYELVCRTVEAHSVGRPSLAAMPGAQRLADALDPEGLGTVALRWLIEAVAARPPDGERPPSEAGVDRLHALADRLVDWGSASDAAHAELGEVRLAIGRSLGCHVVVDGSIAAATETVAAALAAGGPRRALRQHAEWWSDDGPPSDVRLDESHEPEDELVAAIERAYDETWGFRFEEQMRTLAALMDHAAAASGGTAVEQPAAAAEIVHRATGVDEGRVALILDALSLGPVADYDPLTKAHKGWWTNRERSYLRRPLVQLADGRLAWSSAHLLVAGRYLATLVASGRLRGPRPLALAVQRYSQALDRGFEADVGDACAGDGRTVRLRVTELAGQRIERSPAEELGDVDVLVVDSRRGLVWLLDAKRIFPALTPNEMLNEADALAGDVDIHRERHDWVLARPELLEQEIGRPDHGDTWTVRAALVSDFPLLGAHLDALGLPVWSIDEVGDELSRQIRGRGAATAPPPGR